MYYLGEQDTNEIMLELPVQPMFLCLYTNIRYDFVCFVCHLIVLQSDPACFQCYLSHIFASQSLQSFVIALLVVPVIRLAWGGIT